MEEKTLSSIIFGGCIVKSGKYVFFGLVDALPADENNHALITLASGGKYQYSFRNQRLESICIDRGADSARIVVLPIFDAVVGVYDEELVLLRNESYSSDDSELGTSVKQVNGSLYVTRLNGCVYKKTDNEWESFSDGITPVSLTEFEKTGKSTVEAIFDMARASTDLTYINGEGRSLYAVGLSGEIFKYQKCKWRPIASGTNSKLTSIAPISEDESILTGHYGYLARMKNDLPELIVHNIDDSFNCSAILNGVVFVGGYKGLYKIHENSITQIFEFEESEFNCLALDSFEDELLIVSERWFCIYKNNKWERTVLPGNRKYA